MFREISENIQGPAAPWTGVFLRFASQLFGALGLPALTLARRLNLFRRSRLILIFSFSVIAFKSALLSPSISSAETRDLVLKKAIFAGGCFWCMEGPFEKMKGVKGAVSGYSGGTTTNPTYKSVSKNKTGHYEVVEVTYDPTQVTYSELLKTFWRNIDPFDPKGQFCDKGPSYLSAIFYGDDSEKKEIEKSLSELKKLKAFQGQKVATEILKASKFFRAEEYHQDYSKKNPIRYKFYRSRCGRDQRLKQIWGKSLKK